MKHVYLLESQAVPKQVPHRHHRKPRPKGRGKNNYQVFVVIHLLQG